MSFEERNAVIGIFAGLVSCAVMLTVLLQKSGAGAFAGPDGLEHWARTVLWLIAIGIVLVIVMTILVNIAYAMITGDRTPVFLRDERDTIIGLRGTQATLVVLSAGIVIAVIALAMGVQVLTALNIILAACALSSFASEVARLILYRRGF